jgi:hypothetical protein
MTGSLSLTVEVILGVAALILCLWSVALLWASWRIRAMIRSLAAERRELRRWKRLRDLHRRQNGKWQ